MPGFRNHKFARLSKKTVVAVALTPLVLSAGCKTLELSSGWRDFDIAIDGSGNEWSDRTTYLENEDVAVGLCNDDDYLYMAIMTSSPSVQQQIGMAGLTIWLDPTAQNKKTMGIRFPQGLDAADLPRPGPGERPDPRKSIEAALDASTQEIQILGPGRNLRNRFDTDNAFDVHVSFGRARGAVVYEMRLPLKKDPDHPYAADARPGDSIAVGIDSPEFDLGSRGGGPGPGGFGVGRGGAPGGPVGMRPAGGRPGFQKPNAIERWAKVRLAPRPGTTGG
jgi:hypothetical protein